MKNGENWSIPVDKLTDGAVLSLRNTWRLLKDSEHALKNSRFSISIVLSILALEEFGKHFLFIEHIEAKKVITKDEWYDKFQNHGIKLRAWINYLSKMPREKGHEKEINQEIKRFQELIGHWQYRKLEALYLDWDSDERDWFSYDLFDEYEKKKEATITFMIINDFFKIYHDGLRKMPFEPEKETHRLFESGIISAWCKECNSEIKTKKEVLRHRKKYPEHSVGFHL